MSTHFLGRTIKRNQVILVLPAIAGVFALLAWGSTDALIPLKVREAILKASLRTMRHMIDQYAADRRALPSSLDDLVTEAYLRDVPIDPFTGKPDWEVKTGETSIEGRNSRGVIDIHSNAAGKGSDDVHYREY